jgi:VIT1/CCC1 family predicted Fe2+/Mn2+ transporter
LVPLVFTTIPSSFISTLLMVVPAAATDEVAVATVLVLATAGAAGAVTLTTGAGVARVKEHPLKTHPALSISSIFFIYNPF